MSKPPQPSLPEGVSLSRRDTDALIELTIRAHDADELAWRVHDLVPLIQSGTLAELIRTMRPRDRTG